MDPIKDFLEIIKSARAKVYQNLVLFPLLAPESDKPDCLTLEKALREEAVVITEVSEGGQVPVCTWTPGRSPALPWPWMARWST